MWPDKDFNKSDFKILVDDKLLDLCAVETVINIECIGEPQFKFKESLSGKFYIDIKSSKGLDKLMHKLERQTNILNCWITDLLLGVV